MNGNQMQESELQTREEQQQDNEGNGPQLVPMVESIRHRKRARSAEKRAEELAQELAEANEQTARARRDLEALQAEQTLTQKLVAAGVTDLEAALLLAKARMTGDAEADVDACLERLRQEKSYLFGVSPTVAPSRKTAGAKDRKAHGRAALERAAQKAARSRSQGDMQHYLKLRRNLL